MGLFEHHPRRLVGFGSQRGNVTARPHTSSSEAVMIFRGWSQNGARRAKKILKKT
jgi:hypothetical protein